MNVSLDDFDEVLGSSFIHGSMDKSCSVKSAEDERALTAHKAAKKTFAAMEPPISMASLGTQITQPTEDASKVHAAAASTGLVLEAAPVIEEAPPTGNDSTPFPNLGWEILKAGLVKEGSMIQELDKINESINTIQEKLNAVLNFNQKIGKLPSDKDSYPVTDEMREDLQVLKEFGIDLLSPNEKTITSDKLATLKRDLDAIKSNLNTDMQTKFMNVNTATSRYNSLLDSLKVIEKHMSRLMSAISDRMARGI